MRRFLKWILAGFVLLVVIGIATSSGSDTPTDQADKPTGDDVTTAADDTPTPEATVAADPDGESDLQCAYSLGELDIDNPNYTFIGGGAIRNTGNIGTEVRVRITWDQLGADPIRFTKTYRLKPAASRNVKATVPATQSQIDLHQSADGDCKATAKITGTFGSARE